MQSVFKHQDLQIMFGLILTNVCHFHPLEVVGRGRETKLLMGEIKITLNYFWRPKGFFNLKSSQMVLFPLHFNKYVIGLRSL